MSGENTNMDIGELEGGIFVEGIIVGRKKKEFEEKTRINYQIFTGTEMIIVTKWNNEEFYRVGEKVEIPVRISVYRGFPQFTFQDTYNGGEDF